MKTTPRYLTPSELTAICNAVDRVSGELDVLRHIAAAQNTRNRHGIATVTEQIETRRDIAKHVRKLDGLLAAYYTATACVLDRDGVDSNAKAESLAGVASVAESGSEGGQ